MHSFDLMTENSDSGQKFTVCPRVVKLENDISTCKIPVKICNITVKPIVLRPKTELCLVSKVKVIDDITSLSDESPVENSLGKSPIEELGLKIDTTTLDDKQLNRVRQVLGKFDHIFSKHSTAFS